MVRATIAAVAVGAAVSLAVFFLWRASPGPDRAFNFLVVLGATGGFVAGLFGILVAVLHGESIARNQNVIAKQQSELVHRLVERAELVPDLTLQLLDQEGHFVNAIVYKPDWTEASKEAVIVDTDRSTYSVLGAQTRHRQASDLQRLHVVLTNNGAVPATNVLVEFLLPPDVQAYNDSEFYVTSILTSVTPSTPIVKRNAHGLSVPRDNGQRNRSEFVCGAESLGNHRTINSFAPIWLRFPRADMDREYELRAELIADGLKPRTFHFRIQVKS